MDMTGKMVMGMAVGSSLCMGVVVLLYNLFTLVKVMRSTDEETVSPLAKGIWAFSLLSWFCGPCTFVFAIIVWVAAKIETGRIWRDESTFASATPVRVATFNAAFIFLINLIYLAAALFQMSGS